MNLGNGDAVAAVAVLTYEDLNRGVDVGGDTALDLAINGSNGDFDGAETEGMIDAADDSGDFGAAGEPDADVMAVLPEPQD